MAPPTDRTVKHIMEALLTLLDARSYPIRAADIREQANVSDDQFTAFIIVFLNTGLFKAMGNPYDTGIIQPHARLQKEMHRFAGNSDLYTLKNILEVSRALSSRDRLIRMAPIWAALRSRGQEADAIEQAQLQIPGFTLGQIIVLGDTTDEGQIISAISIPWPELLDRLADVPLDHLHKIHWREWEEIIGASYLANGYDEVILTPRSGDFGKDVIAYKKGELQLRVFDQMKAYAPGHRVGLTDVKSVLADASTGRFTKAYVTTTSEFAPNVFKDDSVRQALPNTLQLRDRRQLVEMLERIHKEGPIFR